MRNLILFFLFIFLLQSVFAQVGIGTNSPSTSAKLDITATDKGFLPPRVALTSTSSNSPITGQLTAGLLVYNTANVGDVTPGYYFWNGTGWVRIVIPADITAENLSGTTLNSSIVQSGLTSVGTITSGTWSGNTIAVHKGGTGASTLPANSVLLGNGNSPLQSVSPGTSGNVLTSNGTTWTSAASSVPSNFSSDITVNGLRFGRGPGNSIFNTAVGGFSLNSNTTGYENVSIGYTAGYENTTGFRNTIVGTGAGSTTLTTGAYNTLIGAYADVGTGNLTNATAIGNEALVTQSNTIQLGNGNITQVNTAGKMKLGTITYPNDNGTSGQVLTTNGSGTASWQNLATSGTVQIGGANYGILGIGGISNFSADATNSRLSYMRVGNMVFFTAIIGKFVAMATNQQEFLTFQPPIASNFTNSWDAAGTITSSSSSSNSIVSGAVTADVTGKNLKLSFTLSNANASNMYISVSGSYIVR